MQISCRIRAATRYFGFTWFACPLQIACCSAPCFASFSRLYNTRYSTVSRQNQNAIHRVTRSVLYRDHRYLTVLTITHHSTTLKSSCLVTSCSQLGSVKAGIQMIIIIIIIITIISSKVWRRKTLLSVKSYVLTGPHTPPPQRAKREPRTK